MTTRQLERLLENEQDEQKALSAMLAHDTEAPEVRGA